MKAHTFKVPPFYLTPGQHYEMYRPGSNIHSGVPKTKEALARFRLATYAFVTHHTNEFAELFASGQKVYK
jgi:hypothetical protein